MAAALGGIAVGIKRGDGQGTASTVRLSYCDLNCQLLTPRMPPLISAIHSHEALVDGFVAFNLEQAAQAD